MKTEFDIQNFTPCLKMTQIDKYQHAIKQAITDGPVKEYKFLVGYSGRTYIGALQRLLAVAPPETVYCEVGVYQGLTLVSAAGANPERVCYGIDNFAFFDPDGKNKSIVLERKKKAGAGNIELINQDYEDALEGFGDVLQDRKIGVYFIDGPHDYRSQLMCLELAKPFLHEDAVIVIDDSNYAHVRQANRDFLKTQSEFKLLYQSYTGKHPNNMTEKELVVAREGWWNGVNILVGDPKGSLNYAEPPTVRDRSKFENEHLVHSARFGHFAPAMSRILGKAVSGKLLRAAAEAFQLLSQARKESKDQQSVFPSLNMWGLSSPVTQEGGGVRDSGNND